MKYDRIIAVLGWEDRFILGMKQELEDNEIENISLICYEGSRDKTASNLEKINILADQYGVAILKALVTYDDSVGSWNEIRQHIDDYIQDGQSVLLNISTMPRDMAWTLMFFLNRKGYLRIDYVYHAPKTYGDWLCKEPGRPRLLLNHSGISSFGKATALLILTGYDPDRTQQLVECFEPKLTILGIQSGVQYDNENRNIEDLHVNACKESQTETKIFYIDAYSDDCGYSSIKEQVNKLGKYNLIASSLGPKLTTISLYRVWQQHQEMALAYVPTKEYNDKYSIGISNFKRGIISEPVTEAIY